MQHQFRSLPFLDECENLIEAIIIQAIKDYLMLQNSTAPIEQYYYQTACEFLFDDEYTIDYGGEEKTLNNLLEILDVDIIWLREKIVMGKDLRIKKLQLKRILHDDSEV